MADAGSAAHFFQDFPVTNHRVTTSPIAVRNPNGSTTCSAHEGETNIPSLPTAARTAHIVPDLKSHSLLSVGQLCDSGCIVEFAATTVTVRHNDVSHCEVIAPPQPNCGILKFQRPHSPRPMPRLDPPSLMNLSHVLIHRCSPLLCLPLRLHLTTTLSQISPDCRLALFANIRPIQQL
jgi:hypothetical protein